MPQDNDRPTIVHLTTSPFVGGPERQMLESARSLAPWFTTAFCLFRDRGKSRAFREVLAEQGFPVMVLGHDTPNLPAMVAELVMSLRNLGADVLCPHGYKADVVGLLAARRAGIPAVAVSHGWTGATWKVRTYEAIDRACLRRMDRVVCVSEAQAAKVRGAGAGAERVVVIRDAVRSDRFDRPDPLGRSRLAAMFQAPPERIVGSAGRLSPEKGFGVLVEAAALVAREDPGAGFIHFGDGPLRPVIESRIAQLGLRSRFVLAGFRGDLDQFLPHLDLSVLPSFTEGLPNVVLESYAAGVPVVATAVGGTPEAVADGVDGFLVPPGDPQALGRCILKVLEMGDARRELGRRGRERIRAEFSFDVQAGSYRELFTSLICSRRASPA